MKRFKTSVFRSNLFYEITFRDFLNEDPIENMRKFIERSLDGDPINCGIIYCRTRAACTDLASRLIGKKISAKAYHAGLKNSERDQIQEEWMQGQVKVIVATISFGWLHSQTLYLSIFYFILFYFCLKGMGVDKATVRFVIHWNIPKCMASYYQVVFCFCFKLLFIN